MWDIANRAVSVGCMIKKILSYKEIISINIKLTWITGPDWWTCIGNWASRRTKVALLNTSGSQWAREGGLPKDCGFENLFFSKTLSRCFSPGEYSSWHHQKKFVVIVEPFPIIASLALRLVFRAGMMNFSYYVIFIFRVRTSCKLTFL